MSSLADEAQLAFGFAPDGTGTGSSGGEVVICEEATGFTDSLQRSQGYRLAISNHQIRLSAETATGRFYAGQTLRQLFRAFPTGRLPRLRVLDYPSLNWRGISDDVSRGQTPTRSELLATIRTMSYYKMNLYQLYIEDGFDFVSDPAIAKGHGSLNADDLKALSLEAAQSHVVVCPIFETGGHQTRLLSLPGHQVYAEVEPSSARWWSGIPLVPNGLRAMLENFWPSADTRAPWSFCPTSPGTERYVQSLLDELAPVTTSPWVHIGGDEAADIGSGRSAEQVRLLGVGRVQGRYIRNLAEHLRSRWGRRTMIYSDVLLTRAGAAEVIPHDVTVVDWDYSPTGDGRSLLRLQRQGFHDIIVSPGLWNWNSFTPNYARAFPNIARVTDEARVQRLSGCVVSSWGDGGGECLRGNNWPGYAYAAGAAWSRESPRAMNFWDDFVSCHYGIRSRELAEICRLAGSQEFPGSSGSSRIFKLTPELRKRRPEWQSRMQDLQARLQTAELAIAAARPLIRDHRHDLDCLEHVVRRFDYVTHRELALNALSQPSESYANEGSRNDTDELTPLEWSLRGMQADYETLWLAESERFGLAEACRPFKSQFEGLDRIRRSLVTPRN